MGIEGKYEVVKSENFLEHLIADGIPEERAKTFASGGGGNLEIAIDGDKVTVKSGTRPKVPTYVLNQEVEEVFPNGNKAKVTAKLDDKNVLTIQTKGERGSGTRIYTATDTELILVMTSDKPGVPEAKRFYKRI